jgi:hypothetical protein
MLVSVLVVVIVSVVMIVIVIVSISVSGGLARPARRAPRARAGHLDVEKLRSERAALHPADDEAMRQPQPGEIRLELLAREPEVEQRAEEHVAGDAGEAVEVLAARAARCGGSARSGCSLAPRAG